MASGMDYSADDIASPPRSSVRQPPVAVTPGIASSPMTARRPDSSASLVSRPEPFNDQSISNSRRIATLRYHRKQNNVSMEGEPEKPASITEATSPLFDYKAAWMIQKAEIELLVQQNANLNSENRILNRQIQRYHNDAASVATSTTYTNPQQASGLFPGDDASVAWSTAGSTILTSQDNDLHARIARLERQRHVLVKEIVAYKQQAHGFGKRLQELQTSRQQLKTENEALTRQLQTVETRQCRIAHGTKGLLASLKQKTTEMEGVVQERSRIQEDLASYKSQCQDYETCITDLKSELDQLIHDTESLFQENQLLQSKLQDAETRHEQKLQQTKAQWQAEVETLLARISSQQTQISTLAKQLATGKAEKDSLKQQLMSEFQQQLQHSKERREHALVECNRGWQQRVGTLQSELKELARQRTSLEAKRDSLEAQLEQAVAMKEVVEKTAKLRVQDEPERTTATDNAVEAPPATTRGSAIPNANTDKKSQEIISALSNENRKLQSQLSTFEASCQQRIHIVQQQASQKAAALEKKIAQIRSDFEWANQQRIELERRRQEDNRKPAPPAAVATARTDDDAASVASGIFSVTSQQSAASTTRPGEKRRKAPNGKRSSASARRARQETEAKIQHKSELFMFGIRY